MRLSAKGPCEMNYRHEIDGLRAIAVMGVILYHVGLESISAGYAGVDVFFVISGFLIGGIIFRERADGTFSYWKFYARRARRILPALYTVILFSMLASWFTMMPNTLRYFGGAAMSTLLFISNIWFFEVIDYFNPAALKDPLIHTWSLAVEEQFYFFVPLLFGLLWRFGTKVLFWVFAILAATSLATAILTNTDNPMAAFYLIHTRAWELFAGVLAALAFPKLTVNARTSGWLANLGLLLILGGLGLIPTHAPWPGGWTLIPVAGTMLVLLFGQAPSLARTALTLRPLTIIGLISYSAYLWHQPVISFLDLSGNRLSGWSQAAAAVAAILAVSWLSWRYIEQPFRSGSTLSKGFVRSSLILTALGIAAFSIAGHFNRGYPDRMPPTVHALLAYEHSQPATYKQCIAVRETVDQWDLSDRCIHGAKTTPSVAVWGDSHAALLGHPLGAALSDRGMALQELTLSSCQPIPNLLNYGQTRAAKCKKFNADVMDYFLATPTLKTIIMHASWGTYISNADSLSWIGEFVEDDFYSYPSQKSPSMPDAERKSAISTELGHAITTLRDAGKTVIVVQAIPAPGFRPTKYYGRKLWYGETLEQNIGLDQSLYNQSSMDVHEFLFETANKAGAIVLDPQDQFCQDGICYVIKNGEPLYFDEGHVSIPGAALVVPPLIEVITSPN